MSKILIVDDDDAMRGLLRTRLESSYEVLDTGDPDQALGLALEHKPDAVLLDLVMPGMNGLEVCRGLRSDPATRLLPVVMITASGEQEKVTALEAGADDFVQKPFNQAELLARVASLVRIKTYHDTIQQQAIELAEWNRTLSERVQEQVRELERLGRLRRLMAQTTK